MSLLLTLYCQCSDGEMAAQQGEALLAALARQLPGCQPLLQQAPQRYWKIPEYYGFELQLAQAGPGEMQRLIAACPGNWWQAEDQPPEAIWNPGAGPALLIEATRWAQLLVAD